MTIFREMLSEHTEEQRERANWAAIGARRARRKRRIAAVRAVAAAGALAALVALAFVARSTPSESARLGLPAHIDGPLEVADGSRITPSDDAALDTLEDGPSRVELRLRSGRVQLDIVPGGPRRWVVSTALASVEVVGTRFSVQRGDELVRVRVERGAVLVRSAHLPEGVARVGAGQVLDVRSTPARSNVRPPAAEHEESTAPVQATSVAESVERGVPSNAAAGRVRSPSARSAQPEETPASGESIAPADDPPSIGEQLRRIDALRGEGRNAEAATLLEEIEAIADPPHAALAAFTRGRLELDRLGHPRRAAAAFERALELGLPESLIEDARAARVEAHARSGDAIGARAAAQDYLVHHPRGRWRVEVERWSALR